MATVTVRYFAAFREQAGHDQELIDTDHATAGDLFLELAQRHGFLDPTSRCKVAINDELTSWDAALKEGDQVLFFPPVAGG
ncbi:MAG: MoaD/ThiS family protein [Gammaproteobacteria bacterium]|jgi:molybdopterin converting factor subunit 1